ncbi:MAG: hypothetical protein ACLFP8_03525 [Alphaproteobacteria bacterium]
MQGQYTYTGKTARQAGNALWFILLAVALFGALTATLSRNTSTVNQTGGVEQARIRAASILKYTTAIQTAMQRMLLEGISENELSFEEIGEDYKNTSCTDQTCKIFNVSGGSIPFRTLASVTGEDTQEEWIVSAQNTLYMAGCDDSNSACTDLLLIAPDISRTLCLQINAIQNIENPDGEPPQMKKILTDVKFDGRFTTDINSYAIGGTDPSNEAPQVHGHNTACIMASDKYYFYQLLKAR